MDISERIKELRIENKMSQAELAKKLGVSSGNVGDWESGRSKPTTNALIALKDCFNVSFDWLLTGSDNNSTDLEEIRPPKGKVIFTVNGYGGPQEHFVVDEEDWEVVRTMTEALRKKRDENKKNKK